ncbi:uncharacterized protein [Elaeis guineensis]|uniref:Uncharacterized protein LOC105052643 n=1 Tax=Elaeis guineensis var. tenera TaxID=51953 RepID=A0A8N4F0Z0_ELAGV|nr:uncharacterized protein LOC105052643 [Elaeis guineensis]
MASYKEKNTWMAVPQFGGWDQKTGAMDYSMVFSKARANRQQYKNEIKQISLGNEKELMAYQRYETGSETVSKCAWLHFMIKIAKGFKDLNIEANSLAVKYLYAQKEEAETLF